MATAGSKKKLPSKVNVSDRDYPLPPLPVVIPPFRKSLGEDIMGWVAAMVLVGFLLPMLGMLYLDILEAKHEVKAQVEKIEKLKRELERKERDDSNSRVPPR